MNEKLSKAKQTLLDKVFEGATENDKMAIENLVNTCLNAQVDACISALSNVDNENELTDSDVIWLEKENIEDELKKLKF